MSSPDKCPHCGAESTKFRNIGGFFKCYSFQSAMGFHKTDYCQERAAHAATKRELGAIRRRLSGEETESCPLCVETRGTGEYQSVPMCHVCTLESNLEATKLELDKARAECGIAHDQRRDEANRAEKSEARVRELEGLRVIDNHSDAFSVRATIQLPGNWWPEKGKTLGEAMPGGASVVHGKTCPKAPHIGDGYLHAEDDDKPYDVDGLSYCGRCHHAMPGGWK